MQCEPAWSSGFCNVAFEGQLVIKEYTKMSGGVIVDEPNWMVK